MLLVTCLVDHVFCLLAPEEATAICRDLEEATKALTEAKDMRASKGELDALVVSKHDLEASLLNEQEECRVLHGDMQRSKEQQGVLQNKIKVSKKELAQQAGVI